jgi:hypothetical protein
MKISLPAVEPVMKKYYIGMALLGLVVVSVILVNVTGSYFLKGDYELEKIITSHKGKIDTYVTAQRKLPAVPLDAGITDMQGVEFVAVGSDRYTLCATFKTKSDGYEYSPESSKDLYTSGIESGASLMESAYYIDGDRNGLKHEKGYSCIVYAPEALKASYKELFICGGKRRKDSFYETSSLIIETISASARTTSLSHASYTGTLEPQPYTVGYQFVDDAEFFDENCEPIELSGFKVGDTVKIYSSFNSSNTIKAMQRTRQSSP